MNNPIKQRCCSCCRSPEHNINHCNSIEVNDLLNKFDLQICYLIYNLEETIIFMRNEGTFNSENLNLFISLKINEWLNNELKHTLIAVYYRINDIYECISNKKVTTKLKINEIKEIITENYLNIINDIMHYYNGNITSTFRKYISNVIIKIFQDYNINHDIDYNMHFYNLLHSQYFFNKKLCNRLLYDMIIFIKNDIVFSWYYLCLSDEKKLLFNFVEEFIKDYLQDKYRKKIKITPTLLIYNNTEIIFNDCAICFEAYENKNNIILNCKHSFCGDCIITTIKNNIEKKRIPPCPLCRTNINSVELYNNDFYNVFANNFRDEVGGEVESQTNLRR